MPITANGLEAKKFQDILTEINQRLRNSVAPDINTSPETTLGIIQNIVAEAISDQEELAQAVADAFNIDKAEGKFLADLVGLVYMSRQPASPTTGTVTVTGSEGAVVSEGAVLFDISGNTFTNDETLVVTPESASFVTLSPINPSNSPIGTEYSLTINDITYSYTKTSVDEDDEVILGIISEIRDTQEFLVAENNRNGTFTVRSEIEGRLVNVDPLDDFRVNLVGSNTNVTCTEVGPIRVPEGGIQGFEEIPTGVSDVYNTSPLITGRFTESDEELRARHQSGAAATGKGTIPATRKALLDLQGVSSVNLVVNSSSEPDLANALPPYSIECVVVGGLESDIAETLFNTLPVTIKSVGNQSVNIPYNSQLFSVKFSRPLPKYLYFDIHYSIYDEETFPDSGEDAIKSALEDHVNSLDPDEDFIPKRAYGSIYSSVPGIQDLTINVAAFENFSDFESSVPGDFTEVAVPINGKEYAFTTVDRINVTNS